MKKKKYLHFVFFIKRLFLPNNFLSQKNLLHLMPNLPKKNCFHSKLLFHQKLFSLNIFLNTFTKKTFL